VSPKTKKWAPGWKTTQPRTRESNRDAFWAAFEDAAGQTIRARISAQELKDFGKPSTDLEQESLHTEQVLRAIVETYFTKHGMPSGEIEPADLGSDLQDLRTQFGDCP